MVKNFWDRIVVKNISVILLIGIVLFGLFNYIDFRINFLINEFEIKNEKLAQDNTSLKKQIDNLENFLKETEENFGNVINNQVKNNTRLTGKFNKINDKVSTLTKLTVLDEELLRKYSKVYFLNEHYVPPALVEISEEYISETITNNQILIEVAPFLENMIRRAKKDELDIKIQSAYRSFDTQADLKAHYNITYGSGANKFSADQGYSEHQLGTTVDLTTMSTSPSLRGFQDTNEYEWMLKNAYKYGFVLSYPEENDYYKYEPWHWRFVGRDLAKYLYENELNFYDMEERKILEYLINIFD